MFKSILKIAARELAYVLGNKIQIWFYFIIPFLITLLFFGIYSSQYVLNLPTVVVDRDQTPSSHQFIRYLNQHRYIEVISVISDYSQAMDLVKQNKAFVLVYIPEKFEKNYKVSRSSTIKAYSFGTNLLIGRLVQKGVLEAITAMNRERSLLSMENLRQESAYSKSVYPQIEVDFHNLFNPSYNYRWYLPPAVIMVMFQMLMILICATMLTREKEDKSLQTLFSLGNNNIISVLLGKTLILYFTFTIHYLIFYYFGFSIFSIPLNSNVFIGFVNWSLYAFSAIFLGLSISGLISDSLFATEISVFISAPAFAFSGYTFPYAEMPGLHQIFALIMPSTHYLPLFNQYYLQMATFPQMFGRFANLFGYCLFTFLICLMSLLLLKRNANKEIPCEK